MTRENNSVSGRAASAESRDGTAQTPFIQYAYREQPRDDNSGGAVFERYVDGQGVQKT